MAQGYRNLEERKSSAVDHVDAKANLYSVDVDQDIKISLTEPTGTGDNVAEDKLGQDASSKIFSENTVRTIKKPVKELTILPPPPYVNQDAESELPSFTGRHKPYNLPYFLHTLEDYDLSESEDGLVYSVYCTIKRGNTRFADLEELKAFAVSPLGNNGKSEPSLCLLQSSLLQDIGLKNNVVFHSFATTLNRFGPSIDTLFVDKETRKKLLAKKLIGCTDICKEMETLSRVEHQNVDRLMGCLHSNNENWLLFNTIGISLPFYVTEHEDFPRDQLELCHVIEGVLSGTAALHEKGMGHWNLDLHSNYDGRGRSAGRVQIVMNSDKTKAPKMKELNLATGFLKSTASHLYYDGSTIKITGISNNFPDFRTEPEEMYASPETARYILLNLVPNKEQMMQRISPIKLQDITAQSNTYLTALVSLYIHRGHHPLVYIVTEGRDLDETVSKKRDILSQQLLQMVAELPDILKSSIKDLLNGVGRPFQDLLQRMLDFEPDRRPTPKQALKETEEIIVQLTRNSSVNKEAGPIYGLKRTRGKNRLFKEQEGCEALWMNENQNNFWESKKTLSFPHQGNIQRGQRDKLSHPTQRRSIQTCNIPDLRLLLKTEPL